MQRNTVSFNPCEDLSTFRMISEGVYVKGDGENRRVVIDVPEVMFSVGLKDTPKTRRSTLEAIGTMFRQEFPTSPLHLSRASGEPAPAQRDYPCSCGSRVNQASNPGCTNPLTHSPDKHVDTVLSDDSPSLPEPLPSCCPSCAEPLSECAARSCGTPALHDHSKMGRWIEEVTA